MKKNGIVFKIFSLFLNKLQNEINARSGFRGKGKCLFWAHWLAEGICCSLAICVAETLRNAVQFKTLFNLLWFALEYGLKKSGGTEKVFPLLPCIPRGYAHQRSLPRHSSTEAAAPCPSCIVSVLLCFLCISSSHFFFSTQFISCNSHLQKFSCRAFSFPCRFIKAACVNGLRRYKGPADLSTISRQKWARRGELAPSSLACKLPWPCPANRDSPWHDLVSMRSQHSTGPFTGQGFCWISGGYAKAT